MSRLTLLADDRLRPNTQLMAARPGRAKKSLSQLNIEPPLTLSLSTLQDLNG